MKERLVIGTRGSALALAQTALVGAALRELFPQLVIETTIITTKGDVNKSSIPLDTIGKAWFTAEIEDALANGSIDVAVHSLKDVPPEIHAGTVIFSALKRADPRDVLISKDGSRLMELKKSAVIGTDSMRRKAQLLEKRPDFIVESIRGNVDTRLRKLQEENYDAIVIAAAGLERLGKLDVVAEFFPANFFIPAPGQGVLAVQIRKEDTELATLMRAIQDPDTVCAVEAERAFVETIGSGCKSPTGAYARVSGDTLELFGMHAEKHVVILSKKGSKSDARMVGVQLGTEIQSHA
ncbi:MAG TPA: hydroxymethylbilane synthase [Candidatus Paceibacterota bacterium]|nr:hydroxymethylbilane synthase [Candidatus Paceibacterota bacterium]